MKVGIIGGGVAGCMTAIQAGKAGADVTIIEKNEKLLKKMFITGKGRCNLTNLTDKTEFLSHVVTNPRFLYSCMNEFDCYDCLAFFEDLGVKLKTERGQRVFPASDKSGDITSAFSREAKKYAEIVLSDAVTSIQKDSDRDFTVKTRHAVFHFDKIVLTTGGKSYPATGSTGDGYRFARQFGHTIIEPVPALTGIETVENYPCDLSGLTLKNVRLGCYENDKKIYDELGEMLFTHFGISGPLTLSLSSLINRKQMNDLRIEIDLKPALTAEELDKRVLRDFGDAQNRAFKNALSDLLPKSMIPVVIALSGISPDLAVNSVTKLQRGHLVALLKALPLRVKGLRSLDEAIVTAGGVCVSEVNPKNMESKKLSGLYFAGEVLDLDAFTGGYNLQIALSTGFAAGSRICGGGSLEKS